MCEMKNDSKIFLIQKNIKPKKISGEINLHFLNCLKNFDSFSKDFLRHQSRKPFGIINHFLFSPYEILRHKHLKNGTQ